MLASLCLSPPPLFAATASSIMSQAMLSMMDAMGELAQRFKSNSNWSRGNSFTPYNSFSGLSGYPLNLYSPPGYGWPPGAPLQSPVPGLGGYPPANGLPPASPFNPAIPARSPVDGIWIGRGGEIVLVMYGHFRIYANSEVYRDGLFEISGDQLVMYDPQSEHRMLFDYYLENGHMLLRSETGALLLFKQLPIPIPAYDLFSNPGAGYR